MTNLWESGEDIAEVLVGIDASTTADFRDGVKDRSAFPGFGGADEQPMRNAPAYLLDPCGGTRILRGQYRAKAILLSDRRRANRVLDKTVADLPRCELLSVGGLALLWFNAPVFRVARELRLLPKDVGERLAERTLGQVAVAWLYEGSMASAEDRYALRSSLGVA